MGNKQTHHYNSNQYTTLDDDQIRHIRQNYKVIDVCWLDEMELHSKMFNDEYFIKSPEKQRVVNQMLKYYLNDIDKPIYRMTDYLCDKEEQICICNTFANDFRKIYKVGNGKDRKYANWCKRSESKS